MSVENQENNQPQENLEDLVQELKQNLATQKKVAEWLDLDCGVGANSRCMALTIAFGIDPKNRYHPSDRSDFQRCFHLLEKIPELRKDIQKMESVSPIWKNLVEHWDELETSYKLELENKSTNFPKTTELLETTIGAKVFRWRNS